MTANPTLPTTLAVGTDYTSTHDSLIVGVQAHQFNPPRCKAYQHTLQSLTNNTATAITLDAEIYDSNVTSTAQHDNVTNNSRLTCVYPGLYEIKTIVSFASNVTGARVVAIRKNGATITTPTDQVQLAVAGGFAQMPLSVEENLIAGDYIEVWATQVSGGALNTVADGSWLSFRQVCP